MTGAFTISAAFLMGLAGSLHCAGMCGPIMLILPFAQLKKWQRPLGLLLYHGGRISIYTGLGILIYGSTTLLQPQWQLATSMILGFLLLLLGMLTLMPGLWPGFRLPWAGWVQNGLQQLLSRRGWWLLFPMGMLNGLLPCGMVYMALALSATAPSAGQAALGMMAFGLGTAPMLVTITLLKSRVAFLAQNRWRAFTPYFMLFFGLLFMVRGMNLGIPYLSPKLQLTEAVSGIAERSANVVCH